MNTQQPELIEITPTWLDVLPVLILGLTDGTEEAQKAAREELARMADTADQWIAHVKAQAK